MFFEYVLWPMWFVLPALVANTCPGFARALPGGKVPVSARYLGPNKTVMAVPAALVGAFIVAWLQRNSMPAFPFQMNWLWVGLCFGLGVPLGDWLKSFAKRRLTIPPGGKWWVEKFDFLLAGFVLLVIPYGLLPIHYYLVPLVAMGLLHGPGNRLSYKLGLRNSPH